MNWILVALGGAIGSCLRYATMITLMRPGISFPYATLVVNIAGSFLLGVLYVFIIEKGSLPGHFKPALMIGLLGALTTFSTFSLETIHLAEAGRIFSATLYVVGNLFLSLLACFLSIQATRLL